MLRKININDVPDAYLRAEFTTAHAGETAMIARSFATIVNALRIAQRADRKIRIGLHGHQNGGKSTFSHALVDELCPDGLHENYRNGYSNVTLAPDGTIIHHYDTAGMDYLSFQRRPHSYTDIEDFEFRQHAMAVKHARIQIVEWPEEINRPRYDWIIEMTHSGHLEDLNEDPAPRTIRFFAKDEIAQLQQTRDFISRVREKLVCDVV